MGTRQAFKKELMKTQHKALIINHDYREGLVLQKYLSTIAIASVLTTSTRGVKKLIRAHLFHFYAIKTLAPFDTLLNLINAISRRRSPCYLLLVDLEDLAKNEICKLYESGVHFRLPRQVSARELFERIKRLAGDFALLKQPGDQVIRISEFELQDKAFKHLPSGTVYPISVRQREVLLLLFYEANAVVPSHRLLSSLWCKTDNKAKRSMDVIIYRLRKMLQKDSCVTLETIFKKGIRLNVQSPVLQNHG